ncbi:uncharacterized protein SAMN04487969_101371 [Paenibacillus algorifonticola]|uniref:Metal-binding protein n=1 Tax=Paenibacillus algorifonticola TaxID=684063 RepID=A0A1I1YC98_9BACL|nr:DUF177 domain-containing protein [Paenibacillus algorifonticola]SFE15743.1 uncharacterized protein SAMN04487969_101371 [Paenibacillus algorifonticola]
MQFHVEETMSKRLKHTINESIDVAPLFEGRADVINTGPLHVALEVEGNAGSILVDGQMTIDWELACSRCLEAVQEHTVIPFSEQFEPAPKRGKDEDEQEEDDDSDFIAVSGERLNLQPYVEEALQLFMPFAPLCKSDCKGLCHTCGQNLNEQTCSCNNEKLDHRFAALKDLFKDQ